jgi:hypothetical protein
LPAGSGITDEAIVWLKKKHVAKLQQIGGQILGDPVGKILLLGVVVEIGKRQHDNRQTRRDKGLRN